MYPSSPFFIRKVIHFSLGLVLLALSWLVERHILLILIGAGTAFAFLSWPVKKFRVIHFSPEGSLGTLFYPAGILVSFLLLFNMPMYFFRTALMMLTLADVAAAYAGRIKTGNAFFRVAGDVKSLHGIAGYTLAALIVCYLFLPLEILTNIYLLFFVVLISVILEAVSIRGSDNFSIPVGLALLFLFADQFAGSYLFLSWAVLLLSAGCIALYKLTILTRYGSLTAWLLGVFLVAGMGWEYLALVLLFFLTSVIFTKLRAIIRGKKKEKIARNTWQVTANILWAVVSTVLYLFTGHFLFVHLFVVFIAAVTADTWASEIGPIFNKSSFSVADWQMHPAGFTGGISVSGTIAALAGALFISIASWIFLPDIIYISMVPFMTLSAFLACFADTLLGAFVEDKLLETSFFKTHTKTERITPNDIVNLWGSLTAGIFYTIFVFIYF
jgi:uncharacterized protein (TIGR00297 family)